MTLLCGQRLKGRIYMVSLLDFINSISQMDDIQDVKSSKSWWKSDVLALGKGRGGSRPTAPTPPWLRESFAGLFLQNYCYLCTDTIGSFNALAPILFRKLHCLIAFQFYSWCRIHEPHQTLHSGRQRPAHFCTP